MSDGWEERGKGRGRERGKGRGRGGGGGGVPLSASCVVTYFILMVTLCSKYYYSLIDEVNETQGGQTDKKWRSQNLSPAFGLGPVAFEIPVKCCSFTK